MVASLIFTVIGKTLGWIGKGNEVEVDLGKAKIGTIVERVSASGTVQPVTEVKISPDVAGEIIELQVEEGDSVKQGELLIKIRPDNFQTILDRSVANLNQQKANQAEAKARLAKARAQFIRMELDFQRAGKLLEEKVIADAEFETSETNYKIAKNDLESVRQSVQASKYIVESAMASVKEAQENLRLTKVIAPISGTISKLSVEKGERVVGTRQMAGTEMLRIADLTKMEVRVDVNENDIIRVLLGDTAIIDVDAYSYLKKKFKGVVTAIANTAKDKLSQDAVTEFEVKIRILIESYTDLLKHKNITPPFRPGMTASVEIITDRKEDILTVPLAAVTTRNAKQLENKMDKKKEQQDNQKTNSPTLNFNNEDLEVVFLHHEGLAIMTVVKTGISDYENIEIVEGLKENDELVIGPYAVLSKKLKNNDEIVERKEKEEFEQD